MNVMISETGAGQEHSKGEHIWSKVLIPLVLVVCTGVDGVTETGVGGTSLLLGQKLGAHSYLGGKRSGPEGTSGRRLIRSPGDGF